MLTLDTKIKTFDSEFIEGEKIIEIPRLQRDYAQGRNNPKTNEALDGLLESIYKVITDKNEEVIPLQLNFIYGKYEDNKFIPIDGQQRLTLLYLLHVYFNQSNKNLDVLRYKSRQTSQDFCTALVKKFNEIDLDATENLVNTIKGQKRFLAVWLSDPTVQSMVEVLGRIHEFFKNERAPKCYEKLDRIQFAFLDMCDKKEKTVLADEVYVKMNSRGKELEDFENFKSWLSDRVKEKQWEFFYQEEEWSHLLDTEWTDLFWKYRNGKNVVDVELMSFFRNVFHLGVLYEEEKKTEKEKYKKLREDEYIPNQFYADFTEESILRDIFTTVNFITVNQVKVDELCEKVHFGFGVEEETHIVKRFISRKATFVDRAQFYALHKYANNANKFKGGFDKQDFCTRMRVIRNITHNFVTGYETFFSVKPLLDEIIDSEELLVKVESGVAGELVKEEKIKLDLIKQENWENEILEIENHFLFRGRIANLLYSDMKPPEFESVCSNVNQLFETYGKPKECYLNENLLLRCLVSVVTDWSVLANRNFLFDNQVTSWRDKFSNRDLKDCFKALLLHESNNLKLHFSNLLNNKSSFKKTDYFQRVHEYLYNNFLKGPFMPKCYLREAYGQYYLMPYRANAQWKKYVLNLERISLLNSLEKDSLLETDHSFSLHNAKEVFYYWGWDINFRLEDGGKMFTWCADNRIFDDNHMVIKDAGSMGKDDIIQKLKDYSPQTLSNS